MKKAYFKAGRYGKKFKYHKETEFDFARLDVCGWYFAAEDENGREILGVWNNEDQFIEEESELYSQLCREYEANGYGEPLIYLYAYPTLNGELVEKEDTENPFRLYNPREVYSVEL